MKVYWSIWPLNNYYYKLPNVRQTSNNGTVRAGVPKKLSFCLLLLVTLFFVCYMLDLPFGRNPMNNYWTEIGDDKRGKKSVKVKPPIILAWNRFFKWSIFEFHVANWGIQNCSYECVFTENKTFEKTASMLVFHADKTGELPKERRPEQLYTVLTWEPPPLSFTHIKHLADNFFNMSVTYRTDSTIPIPYGRFDAITWRTPKEQIWSEDEIAKKMALKKRFALQIVSNCGANSGRDELTKQLQKLIELDVLGRCNKNSCADDCYKQQLDSHFFYMAFENSVCPDYVTEKFWNALRNLVVPVVLNRALVKSVGIPDDVYISVDDFGSVQELVDYLNALKKDTKKYLGYFEWTKKYQKNWTHNNPTAICKLCEIAHNQARTDKRRTYTMSLDKFWSDKTCRINYVQEILFAKDKKQ